MTPARLYTYHSKVITLLLSMFLLFLWIPGCGEDQEEEDDAAFVPHDTAAVIPTTSGGATIVSRPQSVGGKIRIEGDSEEVRFRLVDDAVLPFSTYVPDGIIQGGRIAHEGGSGVRFFANFAGKLSQDAYLNIVFPAKDTTFELMKQAMVNDSTGLLHQMGLKLDKANSGEKFCPWARESYSFTGPADGKNVKGTLCMGVHRGRAFYALVHYPGEYAGGFPPRVERILSEIRWDDTGRPLEKE